MEKRSCSYNPWLQMSGRYDAESPTTTNFSEKCCWFHYIFKTTSMWCPPEATILFLPWWMPWWLKHAGVLFTDTIAMRKWSLFNSLTLSASDILGKTCKYYVLALWEWAGRSVLEQEQQHFTCSLSVSSFGLECRLNGLKVKRNTDIGKSALVS